MWVTAHFAARKVSIRCITFAAKASSGNRGFQQFLQTEQYSTVFVIT